MGRIGRPETSVRIYSYSLRNIPEERGSYLLRGGSVQSREGKNIQVPVRLILIPDEMALDRTLASSARGRTLTVF